MRYISADWVFPAHMDPIRNGILVTDDHGVVIELLDPAIAESFPENVQRLEGLLCPGFVNTHCHIELSHLRGQLEKRTGFAGFAKQLIPKRSASRADEIEAAMIAAEAEMLRNGIVAVGDICNSSDSFALKACGRLRYHSFIELIGLNPAIAEKVFEQGKKLQEQVSLHTSTLVPHAPYTVSPELLRRIAAAADDQPLSIHNQESRAENEFFEKGTGRVLEIYEFLKLPLDYFQPTGQNALRSTLPHLRSKGKLLLVHNTFTSADDLAWAQEQHEQLWWCFCPNANLYIEDALPDYQIFSGVTDRITLGTDSLASNDRLSILDEMLCINEAAPNIPLSTLIQWATKNGAELLGMNDLGSFEKGKKPGILHLRNNGAALKISEGTEVVRII